MKSTGPASAPSERAAPGVPRRSIARLFAACVLGIVVVLALAEFVLTAIDYPPSPTTRGEPAGSLSGSNLSPGSPVPGQGGEVIGAAGFRGPSPARVRAPRTLRLVCLGDESTFGVGRAFGECYPSRLRENLVARLVPGIVTDVEVVNAGVPGCSAAQGVVVLNERVIPFRPDFVVVMLGMRREEAADAGEPSGRFASFLGRFRLVRLVSSRSAPGEPSDVPDAALEGRLSAFGDDLRAIARSSADAGARVVFVPVPAASAREAAVVARIARESAADFVDAERLVDADRDPLGSDRLARRVSEVVFAKDLSRENR